MSCPFKVGDRIRSRVLRGEPDMTVTKVSEESFEWKYDKPISFIAREGSMIVGGTVFPMAYDHFVLVNAAPKLKVRVGTVGS